jgi:hypothetical protein
MISYEGEFRNGKKYAELAYDTDFWEFWLTKADGFMELLSIHEENLVKSKDLIRKPCMK